VLVVLICGCNNTQKTVLYLVPKDYQGPLLMIEDTLAKDILQVKGDTTIFDFRKSNILRINAKFVEGSHSLSNLKYYYIDSIGQKLEIPIALGNLTKKDSNKVYVFLKHSQIREGSQCDLITSLKDFPYNFQKQGQLCDSLLSTHPN
jgi:hypothetical protein